MSNYEEAEKPRRNLLVVSCALIFTQVAGIEITAVNVPALSINIQRPEYLLPFVWLMLIYSAWRFWLTVRPFRAPFASRANEHVNRKGHILHTLADQGLRLEGDWLSGNNPAVERRLFARFATVHLQTQDSLGQPLSTPQTFQISYFRHFIPEVMGDLKSILRDKQFVEYDLPLLVALIPILLAAWRAMVYLEGSVILG